MNPIQTQVDKLLRISSEDRQPGQSNSDFTVVYNNSSYVQDVIGVVVKSVSFTNVFDNIFTDNVNDPLNPLTKGNNVFSFRINSLPTIINAEVAPAFYNANQLAAALTGAINAAAFPTTCLVTVGNGPNARFNFTVAGGTIQFLQRNDPVTGVLQNRMANQVGIAEDSAFVTGLYLPQNLPSLGGIREVYICSPELSEGHTVASSNSGEVLPVLVDIPVNAPFGAEIFYNAFDAQVNTVLYSMAKQLTSVNVQLCTRTGRVLDLQQNALTLVVQLLK